MKRFQCIVTYHHTFDSTRLEANFILEAEDELDAKEKAFDETYHGAGDYAILDTIKAIGI